MERDNEQEDGREDERENMRPELTESFDPPWNIHFSLYWIVNANSIRNYNVYPYSDVFYVELYLSRV